MHVCTVRLNVFSRDVNEHVHIVRSCSTFIIQPDTYLYFFLVLSTVDSVAFPPYQTRDGCCSSPSLSKLKR